MVAFLKFIYYWFMTGLAAIASFCFYPCRVHGRENIPNKGGCIFASNHQSNVDPILIPVASPRRMRFLAKDSLFFNPVLGFIIRTGGGIPVKRGSPDKGALSEVLRTLEQGWPVVIFPQGTRGGDKPQPGVGFLAAKSGAPVVPIYIEGTDKVLPKGAKFPRRVPVKVTFGKPFTILSNMPFSEAAGTIMAAINSLRS